MVASGKMPVIASKPGGSDVGSLNESLTCVSRLLRIYNHGDRQEAYEAAQEAYRRMPTAVMLYFRGITAAQVGRFADAETDLISAYEHRDDPQKWLSEQINRLDDEGRAALLPSWQHILCLP